MTGIKNLSVDSIAALVRKHGLTKVAERCGITRRHAGRKLNRAGYRWDGTRKPAPPQLEPQPKLERPRPYRYEDWPPAVRGKGEQAKMQMVIAYKAQKNLEEQQARERLRARRVAA